MPPADSFRRRGRSSRALIVVLAFGVLSGCNLAPPYTAPMVAPPTAYKESGPWTPARPNDSAPRGDWWGLFQDPTLDDLEGRVDSANPTLAAALAAYDQSRAFAAQARASLFPTIAAVDSNTYDRQSNNRPLRGGNEPDQYAVNTFGGDVDYEFDFWGRVRNLVAAGAAEAQAGAADLASARLSLHAQLAEDYLNLRGLDAQAKLLASTVDAYQRALNLTQARHTGGVASGLDVDRASAQLTGATAQISEVAAQRALYEHAIASLIGEPASRFGLTPSIASPIIPEIPAGVPSALVQRRPDIAAAERRAFAANRQIGVARAAYFPTISLDAQGGFQNTGGQDLLIAPNTFWTIGPQAALTILDFGRRRATVAASKAAFLEASAAYRATVLTAFQQVEDQLALANHLTVEAGQDASTVRSTRAAANLSLVRYSEGATNYLDVVTAQEAELDAERAALTLETRRRQVAVELVRALGGGWSVADLPSSRRAASLDKISAVGMTSR